MVRPLRIAVIHHDAGVSAGHLDTVLGDAAVPVRLDRGEPVPDPAVFDAVVSLGGHMGAYDEDAFPFLVAEKAMLREAVAANVPVLGVCLGCQLLADALGGSAHRAPSLEVRFAPCDLTVAGAGDRVVRHLGEPVLSVHQDTWEPPPGATPLASSAAYPQAFRKGSALGIQPHPEVTPEIVARWIPEIGPDRMRAVGADPDELLALMRASRQQSADTAKALFGAWLDEVAVVAAG